MCDLELFSKIRSHTHTHTHTHTYIYISRLTIVSHEAKKKLTKQIVPSMHQESFTRSLLRSFSPVLCVRINNIFTRMSFFFRLFVFSFSSHSFSWACGSLREPRMLFSFCAFTCLSNNSLIS